MSNIKDNSEYWAKGLTVAVDRPTLLTESPAHTNKQYYIQAENVFVVVQAPDYIPGSDGGPEVVFANGRIGLLKNLTGDVDLEGALLVANNLSDLANTAAARTNLGLGSLAIKNSVDNNDWAGADLSISNGGTGASDAAEARSNLGLGDLATQSTVDNTDWFGDALEVSNGGTGASDAAGARTNLGLGALSTKSTINNNDWSGVDLDVSNGGTGASDAPSARTNLGLGDAATRTVQTSSTDTTAGALMAVGAFGIGGNGPFVDANSVSVTGLYNCATNAPTSGSHSLYHHEYDANTAMQLAIKGGGDQLFFRRKASDSWQPWKEILKQGDYGLGKDNIFSADADNITENGWYVATVGTPTANVWQIMHRNDTNGKSQEAIEIVTGKIATRSKIGAGAWSSWKYTLQTGDYGLGVSDAPAPAGNDLNNALVNGWWEFNATTTNRPNNQGAGVVFVMARDATRIMQMAVDCDGSTTINQPAIREYNGVSWTDWQEMVLDAGRVKDLGGTHRRVGWTQGQITFNDGTLSDAYVNNTIRCTTSSGSNTITIPQNLGINTGDLIQIVNVSATPKTIAQASGVGLNWLQGGSISSGNRTLAAYSVATLHKYADNTWYIWGNGIS